MDPQQFKKTMSNKLIHIFLCTFIYLHIHSYTFIYLQIALYTFITPTYIKILNIRKMRANIKHTNCHNSGFRASLMARIWHARYYHIPRCFCMPNRSQNQLKYIVSESFGGVIQIQNPMNRAPCTSFKGGRVLPLNEATQSVNIDLETDLDL